MLLEHKFGFGAGRDVIRDLVGGLDSDLRLELPVERLVISETHHIDQLWNADKVCQQDQVLYQKGFWLFVAVWVVTLCD